MAVRMLVSVVRAMARRAGRSTVRRETNSATRCWASAAEPPLPQTMSLRPDFMAAAVMLAGFDDGAWMVVVGEDAWTWCRWTGRVGGGLGLS